MQHAYGGGEAVVKKLSGRKLIRKYKLEIIMSATEMLCHLIGVNPCQLSKVEGLILEVELFVRLCDELKVIYKTKYKDYFRLLKCDVNTEQEMLDAKFLSCVITDILSTEEYTLDGIAHYVQTPAEVISDIASGQNTNPSLVLSRRIIDLHRTVRVDLYQDVLSRIVSEELLKLSASC